MKRNAITRIIIYSLTIVVLSTILLGGMGYNMFSIRNSSAAIRNTEETMSSVIVEDGSTLPLTFKDIKNVEVDWAAGSITVQTGDVSGIVLQESSRSTIKNPMIVKEDGSTLKIQFCENPKLVGINTNLSAKDLTITVPAGWECRSLKIDAASANIAVCNQSISNADINTASGNCTFTDCAVGKLDIDSASGDVAFCGTLLEFDCDSVSCNAELTLLNNPKKISMDSVSGDLKLTLPSDCGFSTEIEGMSKHFECEFATTHSGNRYLCGDGSCKIELESLSGSVKICKGEGAACDFGTHCQDESSHRSENAHH